MTTILPNTTITIDPPKGDNENGTSNTSVTAGTPAMRDKCNSGDNDSGKEKDAADNATSLDIKGGNMDETEETESEVKKVDTESTENDDHSADKKRNDKKKNGEEGVAARKGPNYSVGRRGDPRMHGAVAARRANPNMSLLEALIIGGFVFPEGTDGSGKSDRTVYDSDNVLLCQRKNQLSRRLRLAKRRAEESVNDPVDNYLGMNHSLENGGFFHPSMVGTKRAYNGQMPDEQQMLDKRFRGDNLMANNPALFGSNVPQSALTALLQHQQQLNSFGQSQGLFGAAAGNPFLFNSNQQERWGTPAQLPYNFGGARQSDLDQYLQMTNSMGRMLYPQHGQNSASLQPQQNIASLQPQQNIASLQLTSNRPSFQGTKEGNEDKKTATFSSLNIATSSSNAATSSSNAANAITISSSTAASADNTISSSPLTNAANTDPDPNGTIVRSNQEEPAEVVRDGKLKLAAKEFLERRKFLIEKCLVSGGFDEIEASNNESLKRDFEEILKKIG